MSFVTWNDLFLELWMQAAQSRGSATIGELPGAPHLSTIPEWPRTTGADVIAIASLIDPVLSEAPVKLGSYGLTRLWQAQVIEIEGIAFSSPTAEYAQNRGFWSTLLAVAVHLARLEAPLPEDEAWETLMGAIWTPIFEQRNAAVPVSRTFASSTVAGMWEVLRAEHVRIRGVEARTDDEFGGTIEIPRTTNGDARRLESYWSRALVQLQVRVMTGAVPSPEDFEAIQLEWQAVTARAVQDVFNGKPTDVYPDNVAFWRASRALASALDLLQERPAPYVVLDDATPTPTPVKPSQPQPNVAPAKPKQQDLSSRLSELADNAVTAVAHAVNDAGNRLVSTVGRPLLFTGAMVAALLLVLKATAPCECEPEPAPEPTPTPATDAEAG
jgi:hypothetical protein